MKTRAPQLAREEWDFGELPDSELRTCYLYEFAREAERARYDCTKLLNELQHEQVRVHHEFRAWLRRKPGSTEDAAMKRKVLDSVHAANSTGGEESCGPHPLQRCMLELNKRIVELKMRGAGPPIFQFEGLRKYHAPKPWQKLTAAGKNRAAKIVGEASLESVPALRVLGWHPGRSTVISVDPETSTGPSCTVAHGCAAPDGGAVLHPLGQVSIALTLDLPRVGDQELLATLRKLLPALRHKMARDFDMTELLGPGKSDTKLSALRAHLFNLGIMRLRHAAPAQEVIAILGGDGAKQPNGRALWRDEIDLNERREILNARREQVLKKFRELFPLPKDAEPERWEPFIG